MMHVLQRQVHLDPPKGGSSPSRGMTNLTYVVRYVGDVNTTFESRGASTYYFVCILDIFVPVRVF